MQLRKKPQPGESRLDKNSNSPKDVQLGDQMYFHPNVKGKSRSIFKAISTQTRNEANKHYPSPCDSPSFKRR